MSALQLLLLGFGLGLRHATDADHVAVVSMLLSRESGPWRAARVAALWGVGHTLTFLGLGLLVILAGLRVPEAFEDGAEMLVAALLVGFGAWHLLSLRGASDGGADRGAGHVSARPVAVGLAHGLAGSTGAALLAAAMVPSRGLAAAYLCVVALGTVIGMVALTMVLSRPLSWERARARGLRPLATVGSGLLGVILGLWILIERFAG